MEQGLGQPPQPAWWWRLPTFWCRILDRLVAWDRPLTTCSLLLVIIQMIWFVAFSPCRLSCALCVSLAVKVVLLKLKDMALSTSTGAHLWRQLTASWEELMDSGQDSRSSLGPEVSESFRMFLQETSSFKQQNPGKFCLLVCSVCTFFAVVGRYIPGVVISYILVLGVFLWPLISSPEFLLWLKPVLQKLDFGVGDFLHRIKENHEKRLLQAQGAEKENIEADLSSMFPKLDSTVCKEMCVSDTDVSDVTWTDNGTFNLSEGHTPQTENSEDLDKEEAFTGGLPEFPSLDNGLSNGDSSSDLSIGLPTPPPPPPPAQANSSAALELVQQMASDAIAAAVSSAIQERIEAAVVAAVMTNADHGQSQRRSPRPKPHPQDRGGKYSSKSTQEVPATVTSLTPFDLAEEEESDSEAEDFELLDQSELEQLQEEELLGGGTAGAEPKRKKAEREPPSSPSSSSAGFFSKLLGRH